MRKWPAVVSGVLFAAVASAAGFFPAIAADGVALEVTLTPRTETARTGEAVAIDVTVANPSTGAATDIEVIFVVDGLAAIEPEGCVEPWTGAGCSLGDIPPGDARSVVLSGLLAEPGSVTVDGTVTNGDAVSAGGASVDASGPACTVLGTLGADALRGTRAADVICAGPGDDRIEARAGDDRVFAGGGSDQVLAGWGDDRIDGDGGVDTLVFDQGMGVVVDVTSGRSNGGGRKRFASIEAVRGTPGDDFLQGGRSGEALNGRAGDDKVVGRRGPDSLMGGSGEDDLSGGQGADRVDGGSGVDTCLKGPDLARCERRRRPQSLAGVIGLEVFLPGRRIEGVGFHESLFSTAAAMTSRSDSFFVMSSHGARHAGDVRGRCGHAIGGQGSIARFGHGRQCDALPPVLRERERRPHLDQTARSSRHPGHGSARHRRARPCRPARGIRLHGSRDPTLLHFVPGPGRSLRPRRPPARTRGSRKPGSVSAAGLLATSGWRLPSFLARGRIRSSR